MDHKRETIQSNNLFNYFKNRETIKYVTETKCYDSRRIGYIRNRAISDVMIIFQIIKLL